jgi:Trypsin
MFHSRTFQSMCCILFTFFLGSSAEAESFSMAPLPVDPVVEPQIVGGRLAKRSDWPATFIFKDRGEGVCTSTAVGRRVVLTAAHCVENGVTGSIESNGKPVKITCDHHPEYTPKTRHRKRTTSADWALCAASGDIELSEYETVNVDSKKVKLKQELLLTGFGCNKEGGSDGGFGQLFEGEANVTEIPSVNGRVRWKKYYVTTFGGAAICSGDSGGATFKFLDAAKKSRVIVGVNSRGDFRKVSRISSTSTESFTSWAKKWASKPEGLLEICGLHPGASSCHP